jgi:hypothetical protein
VVVKVGRGMGWRKPGDKGKVEKGAWLAWTPKQANMKITTKSSSDMAAMKVPLDARVCDHSEI